MATIAIHRRLGLGSLRESRPPCPARTRRTGCPRVQVDQGLIAVTPYHRRSRPEPADRQRWPARFDLLGRGDGGLDDRRGVATMQFTATIAPVSMSTASRVRQMRAAIFHLRDLRIGIVGVRPVVRGLLLPLPIQSRQTLARGRLDPRGRRETRQKRLVASTMLRIAAFASSVVASIAMVLPVSRPASTSRCAPRKDGPVPSRSIKRRVRAIVE